jgi:filamentous hemagglutinin
VKPGQSGTYGDLKNQKKTYGETEPLDMDHRPSYAAQKKALEDKLGRKLTDAEAKALKNNTPAVSTPRPEHQQNSRTYGARNTPEQIAEDAKDLDKARRLDEEAMRK